MNNLNNFIARQLKLFRGFIEDYQLGKIELNTLVNNIWALHDVIADFHNQWRDDVFRVIENLEEINAVAIVDRSGITKEEVEFVNQQLSKLVLLADRLDGDDQDS